MSPHIIEFPKIGSNNIGFISFAQNSELPFEIKRCFWTYYTPNEVLRGKHAHKELEQILLAVSGKIEVEVESASGETSSFTLEYPDKGVFIPKLHWTRMRFSHNAVLLSLASAEFDHYDYIRDYDTFKKLKSL